MKVVTADQIAETVKRLCVEANNVLPDDLRSALEVARQAETSSVGRSVLQTVLDNIAAAQKTGLPLCQDTGMAVVSAEVGQDVHIEGGFEEAVCRGVREGYREGYLRLSVVGDPLRRQNTGDNTPPVLHTRLVPGDALHLTVAPKGFGSENMTRLHMFDPSAGKEDIIAFVTETVVRAGGNPCPPVLVGIGLGGTAEQCIQCAKQALLRPVGSVHPDAFYADMERETLAAVNATGVGPQGLGGSVTALCVHIEARPTHIAGLPCAVCLGCHVTRHASAVL